MSSNLQAVSDVKKARLEAEEAARAKASIPKYAKLLAQVEIELERIKVEIECREAEAKARNAQAEARRAEAKAIKVGDIEAAEARRLDAKLYHAEALAKNAEIKALKAKSKTKKALPEPQSPVNQFPKRQARYEEKKYLSAKGLLSRMLLFPF